MSTKPPISEREKFLADWYRLLRKYQNATDPAIAYALKLHRPILDEATDYAARHPEKPDLTIVSRQAPIKKPPNV